MYVWTRKEIAEAFEVANGTVSYWTKVWGPETDHPFPVPVAKLAMPKGPHQKVYDPGSVQVWFNGLSAAKARRMSKAQMGIPKPRKRPPVWGNPDLDKSIIELEESMALLMETINEMEALQEVIRRG
tara:strand:+ start:998 stop:1378 length:381 start_codon:yes stop_codon:yes gene_type:complete